MVDLGPVDPAHEPAAGGLTLRQQVILTAQEPLLAVLEVPGGLVALEPEQIVRFMREGNGWREKDRVSIHSKLPLARDPRGILLASQNGQGFEAWLSGTECAGSVSVADAASDSAAECKASDDPWPIVATSNGPDTAAPANTESATGSGPAQFKAFYNGARDYFVGVVAPAVGVDLPPFYTATSIFRPAGGVSLLIGGIDGKVRLVENGALWTVAGTRDWGSDFAMLRSSCGAGVQIIASGSGEAAHDSLRAYELPALEAVAASAPLAMDGTVTALWNAPDGKSVFAVVRDEANQYEVGRVTALCN
jgi:hypothetical protein